MTHQELDAEFSERLTREETPRGSILEEVRARLKLEPETVADAPRDPSAPEVLRQKMLERLPALATDGVAPVPNQKFWDYYNDGGKERLHEAGIGIFKDKDTGTWMIRLHPETAGETRQKKIDAFMKTFRWHCDCGKPYKIQAVECSNGVMQYRLRCSDWFEIVDKTDRFGSTWKSHKCYLPKKSPPIPHAVVDHFRYGFDISVIKTEKNPAFWRLGYIPQEELK